MNWGLAVFIAGVVFLVGHIGLDLRSLVVQWVRHFDYGLPTHTCERCRAIQRDINKLRHESTWTAAALVVLIIHIILDLTG